MFARTVLSNFKHRFRFENINKYKITTRPMATSSSTGAGAARLNVALVQMPVSPIKSENRTNVLAKVKEAIEKAKAHENFG